jgi:hypothetical protein
MAEQIEAKRATVEMDVYSGMPNPAWELTSAEIASLVKQVAELPPASRVAMSGRLGYRGFIVSLQQETQEWWIRVYAGIVEINKDPANSYALDEQRRLERWLLGTRKAHLNEELRRMAESDLDGR